MIFTCPNCQTQFELDAARLPAGNIKLKCSRCRAVFPAPTEKKQPPATPRKRSTAPSENLELPFDEPNARNLHADAPVLAVPDTDEPYTLGGDERFELFSEEEAGADFDAPVVDSPVALTRDFDDEGDGDDEAEHEPAHGDAAASAGAARASESGMVVTILVALAVTLLGYGSLTAAFFSAPAWCDEVVGQLWFVSGQGSERLLPRKIMLEEVTGTHQSIKDDKHVFVINGKAYNTAAESLQNVQIVGTLYDAHGKEVARKTIHLGNVVSTKVLSEMSRKEIEVFHGLNMSWRNIEPGQSYPFVIVFTDPPKSAIDFTARVSGAYRPRG